MKNYLQNFGKLHKTTRLQMHTCTDAATRIQVIRYCEKWVSFIVPVIHTMTVTATAATAVVAKTTKKCIRLYD